MPKKSNRAKKGKGKKKNKKNTGTQDSKNNDRNKVKKNVQEAKKHDVKEPSPSQLALRENLRKRLRTRQKMFQTARQGGTRQEVQKIMQNFNDDDDEKADMMREIQEDVKGMKSKDAKKYLKQVIGGMNSDQTDSFMGMIKDKMPSSHSREITNYVKRQRKVKDQEEALKPRVNPETVYVPARLMTEDQKETEKTKRRLVKQLEAQANEGDAETSSPPKKKRKKKSFNKVHIRVPNLNEMQNLDVPVSQEKVEMDVPKPSQNTRESKKQQPEKEEKTSQHKRRKRKKGFGVAKSKKSPGLEDIEELFSPHTTREKEISRLAFSSRMRHLLEFSPENATVEMKQHLLEASDKVEVVKMVEVKRLPLTEFLPVPNSDVKIRVQDVPEGHIGELLKKGISYNLGETHGYRCVSEQDEKGQETKTFYKVENAYLQCSKFIPRFDKVLDWLEKAQSHHMPLHWVYEKLNDLGIIRKKSEEPRSAKDKEWRDYFRLLCHERKDADGRVTVPIVPYVKITWSC